jgi:prepilin-type processing-associated H-X9-DG protein
MSDPSEKVAYGDGQRVVGGSYMAGYAEFYTIGRDTSAVARNSSRTLGWRHAKRPQVLWFDGHASGVAAEGHLLMDWYGGDYASAANPGQSHRQYFQY